MIQMKYFLSIIGTTSTGKSDFALELAETLITTKKTKGVILLSADSRQVYQGLEILSGADIPVTFINESSSEHPFPYYQHPTLPLQIHGQSIIKPNEQWSVAQFKTLATQLWQWCIKTDWLLIVVGGTGLYHAQLDGETSSLFIPPQQDIRETAEQMSVSELQSWLTQKNAVLLESMNNSDKHNPRRLVRAIEKATVELATLEKNNTAIEGKHLTIGLKKDLEKIEEAILKRISKRLQLGVTMEVATCLSTYGEKNQASSMLGFAQLSQYIQEKTDQDQAIELWHRKEVQYAKRQLTWWKKFQPDLWLDSNETDKTAKVIDLIEQYV